MNMVHGHVGIIVMCFYNRVERRACFKRQKTMF